jgi:hypothetical protein
MNTMRDALCVTEAGKALVIEAETKRLAELQVEAKKQARKQAAIDLADRRVKAFSQFLYDTIVRHAPKGYSRDYLYNLYRSARCSIYYICFHKRAKALLESVESATKYMWDTPEAYQEIKTWIREPGRYVRECV